MELSITRAIVEKMGGHIGFSSVPNVLTTFFIEFSIEDKTANSTFRKTEETKQIFICDDDPLIVELLRFMLDQDGYAVDVAYIQTLHRMVHSLTGSGKTFGFSLLSDIARNLEEYIKQLAQAETALNEQQRSHIYRLIRELHQVILHRNTSAGDNAGLTGVSPIHQNSTSSKCIFVVKMTTTKQKN